jgi:hypothetical protein
MVFIYSTFFTKCGKLFKQYDSRNGYLTNSLFEIRDNI